MPILHTLLSPQLNILNDRLFGVAGVLFSPFTPATDELPHTVSLGDKIPMCKATAF